MKAYNIIWDVDDKEELEMLPTEIEIPEYMADEDEISNFISEVVGYCHNGYSLTSESNAIEVLLVRPNMYPERILVGCNLKEFQEVVGGYIQAVYPYDDPVALLMDEEGKMLRKELNRALRDEENNIYDVIAGNFLIVGLGEESFASLTPELIEKYNDLFHQPETFVSINRDIIAIPVPDHMINSH